MAYQTACLFTFKTQISFIVALLFEDAVVYACSARISFNNSKSHALLRLAFG